MPLNNTIIANICVTGSIQMFAGSVAPEGFFICDGSAVSRLDYANLFNVIGITYGNGDGSTTFNIPNFKGKVPVGHDDSQTEFDTLGKTGGEKTHLLTSAESGLPAHSHSVNPTPVIETGSNEWGFNGGDATRKRMTSTYNNTAQNASQSHNNLQPYISINYLIKH